MVKVTNAFDTPKSDIEPKRLSKWTQGKGSKQRPLSIPKSEYDTRFDKIFKK